MKMGLIKAALGSIGGTLADQWKEFFYCDSMTSDVLAAKAGRRTGKRSSNYKGDDNIVSNGSVIAVNDGQCMMIVEQGQVVDVCAEPGEYVYDQSTEPSIFTGGLGQGIKDTFATIGRRFAFGGESGKDQRVYYFNLKEIMGNKYGTVNPVPFRVVDRNIGLDVDISIRCNGEYSYQIADPLLFYKNVCGNVTDRFTRSQIDSQLKSELLTALQPAFARLSDMGIRYSSLPGHTMELADALNAALTQKWQAGRGIKIANVGVNSVTASAQDEDMIKNLQKNAVFRDATMSAANLSGAQADAMRIAAGNSGGSMTGFMGLNMAQQTGGVNANDLYAIGRQQQTAPQKPQQPQGAEWACSCGAISTGKFCPECGKPRPAQWICPACGAVNTGRFCAECGAPRV
jgi:membrane protease subunit (stomatin/prohibitin family)